jgi:hypothetical protein
MQRFVCGRGRRCHAWTIFLHAFSPSAIHPLQRLASVGLLSLENADGIYFPAKTLSPSWRKKATSPPGLRSLKRSYSNINSCWPMETLILAISVRLGGSPCSAASGVWGRNASGSHGAR